jgi:hypothetical protein
MKDERMKYLNHIITPHAKEIKPSSLLRDSPWRISGTRKLFDLATDKTEKSPTLKTLVRALQTEQGF